MGPSAIRYAGLAARIADLGHEYVDLGNVETAVAEATATGDEHARFLPEIKDTSRRIAGLVAGAARDQLFPVVLGGDHSVALGTLAGLRGVRSPSSTVPRRRTRASCSRSGTRSSATAPCTRTTGVWTRKRSSTCTPTARTPTRASPETSPSGNVHGMVLAAALGHAGERFQEDGWGLPALAAGRVALVGVRALDEGERALLGTLDARVFTMSDVDRLGVERVLREALAHVAGPGFVHVSLDMDALDPDVAPGVGTPVRGGLSYREAHLAMELIAESGLASSLDVVEVNPVLDRENETGKLAVELVASALGARIL